MDRWLIRKWRNTCADPWELYAPYVDLVETFATGQEAIAYWLAIETTAGQVIDDVTAYLTRLVT